MSLATPQLDDDGRVQLETSRLLVRSMVESDLPDIYACYDNPEVGRYCAPVRWPDMTHALTWFHRRRVDVLAGRARQLVIVARSKPQIVGTAVLFNIDATHRNAEIGYALGRDFWGQGYVTEAVSAVIRYAFGELQLHRLNATIDTRNIASAKALSRLGFQYEGSLRQSYFDIDEFTDCGLYGLLAHEWENLPVGAGNTPIPNSAEGAATFPLSQGEGPRERVGNNIMPVGADGTPSRAT